MDLFLLCVVVLVGEIFFVLVYDVWMEKMGKLMLDGIGVIEMLYIFMFNWFDDYKFVCIGKLVLGYKVKIVG